MVVKSKNQQALKRHTKLLEKLQKLAAEDPAYRDDLARTYVQLWALLTKMDRLDQALEMGEKALELFRELAAEQPDAYLADLAALCDNLGKMLAAMERYEEALELLNEGLRINQELGDQDPKAYLPVLAGTYMVLTVIHRDLGDMDQAREWAGHALFMSSLISAQEPKKHVKNLISALDTAANVMGDLDQSQRQEWLANVWNRVLETIRWLVTPVAGPLGDFFLQAGLTELALEPFLLAQTVLREVGADGVGSYDGPIAEIAAALGPERTAALQAKLEEKFAPLLDSLPG